MRGRCEGLDGAGAHALGAAFPPKLNEHRRLLGRDGPDRGDPVRQLQGPTMDERPDGARGAVVDGPSLPISTLRRRCVGTVCWYIQTGGLQWQARRPRPTSWPLPYGHLQRIFVPSPTPVCPAEPFYPRQSALLYCRLYESTKLAPPIISSTFGQTTLAITSEEASEAMHPWTSNASPPVSFAISRNVSHALRP